MKPQRSQSAHRVFFKNPIAYFATFAVECIAVTSWLLGFILLFLAESALGQNLEIAIPGPPQVGVPQPLIWGRLSAPSLLIGSETIVLSTESPNQIAVVKSPPPAPTATISAAFLFKPKEKTLCVKSPRFASFMHLLKSFGPKVTSVRIQAIPDWELCRDAVAKSLAAQHIPAESLLNQGEQGEETLSVTVGLATAKHTEEVATEPSPPTSLPRPIAKTPQLTIDGQVVALNDDGWFVFVGKNYEEVELKLEHPEYATLVRKISPWPTALGTSIAPVGASFGKVTLAANAAVVSIRLVPNVPATKDLVVEINPGFGLGRAKGLPGEANGKRAAFAAALSSRKVLPGYRVQSDVSATTAGKSSVPWTVLADLVLMKDRPIKRHWGLWNVGIGAQLFWSKIKKQKSLGYRTEEAETTVAVPESVVSPLATAGLQIGVRRFFWETQLNFTPLYVFGSGFYPSLNFHVATGYRLTEGLSCVIGGRVDTIRFPTPTAETILTLQTVYLGLNLGLFM